MPAITQSYDRGYGPSIEEFTEFTNRTITNSQEFYRQRARAQEVFDAVAGKWPPFHLPQTPELSSVSALAITSPALNSSFSGYFNNLELRVVEGTGRGFRGYIADYDGTTGVATVSGVSGDLSSVSISDTTTLTQITQFPRFNDIDISGRPRVPEALPRIISYIIEYWVNLQAKEGFNADELANMQTEVTSESFGVWSTSYKNDRNPVLELIGPKAYQLADLLGLFRHTAQLKRFSADPLNRRFI